MWVYLLGVFFLLLCTATAKDDGCPNLDVNGCYTFDVVGLDLEKVKNCLREHLTKRLQNGEDININTIITPIKETNADDHSTTFTSEHTAEVTTTSITTTLETEVPSSTTVLYSPAMTGANENPGANRSSTTVLSSLMTTGTTANREETPPSITAFFSSSQTQATNKPGVESQGGPTNVNVTAKYGITSCPPYCGSTFETSYINHTWCVVKNQCNCNGSILELKKHSTKTAHACMRSLQKDCPSTCEFYVKNPQFFNSSTVYPRISAPGLWNVICECANGSESGLPSTYGWLIIQRRLRKGTTDFNESSAMIDYETPVWGPHNWLGLERIYALASDNASLQIEFGKINSTGAMEYFFVRYSHFSIGNKSINYRLNVIEQPHCGNDTNRLPDYLDPKSVRPVFAVQNGSGWWFYNNSGLDFNLNAKWNNGIRWGNQTYDTVMMKILPGGAEKVLCVNLTEKFLILQCPQSCSSTKSSVHKWCVRDSCICDRPRERWNDITDTSYKAENCFVPVGDNCIEACQIWSRLKIPTSTNIRIARIKIYSKYEKVYCDCSDQDPGWLVIWHKENGKLSRSTNLEVRINDTNGNYWIGFNTIGRLTDQYNASLLMTVSERNSSGEQGTNHIIKYQFFFKKGNDFIGEHPSAVNSSDLVPPKVQKFQMQRDRKTWLFELVVGGTIETKFGRLIPHGSYRYDVMEMKIMTGQVLCPVAYGDKCFLPFTEFKVEHAGRTELCKSIGGHLANIYSQDHMDEVKNFIRDHRMSENYCGMYFQLGMTYQERKLYLHNGTEANSRFGQNFLQKIVKLSFANTDFNDIVALKVAKHKSSVRACYALYALCEIDKT